MLCNRIGLEKLWVKFDKALDQLGVALEGDGFAQLAAVSASRLVHRPSRRRSAIALCDPPAPTLSSATARESGPSREPIGRAEIRVQTRRLATQ
jgi:hypothetical protein